MQSLRFVGDLSVYIVGPLAIALVGAAWWLYRRQVKRGVSTMLALVLPLLRAAAVLLIVLMLAGPVLRHRQVIGELGRVLVFVDTSRSMSIGDPQMPTGRKLLIAQQQGWLPPSIVDTGLVDVADRLAAIPTLAEGTSAKESAAAFARQSAEVLDELRQVTPREVAAALSVTGSITRELFRDSPLPSVEDVVRLGKPAAIDTLDAFRTPRNVGDNYAQRVRGYIVPPVSGTYTFRITSDDDSRLYLSTGEDPSAREMIAKVTGYHPPDQWPDGESRSQPVQLQANRRYYIEAIHREGGGEDHLSVGWQLPDGATEQPIPGSRLFPFDSQTAPIDLKTLIAEIEREIVVPARSLATRAANASGTAEDVMQQLAALHTATAKYEAVLRASFEKYAVQLAHSGDRAIEAAIMKFDAMPRFGRVEASLLESERGLLDRLRAAHHVEVVGLGGSQAATLWSDVTQSDLPQALPVKPEAFQTDLATTLRQRIPAVAEDGGDVAANERVAVVLFSDGQHNQGPSPLQIAQLLGNRLIPLHTVGIGSVNPPRDMAVLRVEAPPTVSKDDRVRGHIVLTDHMPAGKPFTLRIEHEGQTLWQQDLLTEDVGLHEVPFDFAIDKLVESKLAGEARDVKVLSLPLAMQAIVEPIDGEVRPDNNAAPLHFRAITQNWKLLLIDGRSRWETRYLHNLFDRDERWQVNLILAGPATERTTIPRGDGIGMFPADKQALLAYDLVIFGELPPGLLNDQELSWLNEFVQNRGGGIVFIDGQRGHLARYAGSALGPLIPVTWSSAGGSGQLPSRITPTRIGAERPPLVLASTSAENVDLWRSLPPPHWVAAAKVTPGTGEVLAEVVVGETRVPLMVERRVGAGRVVYLGTDETWRWRYEAGDVYYARFWHQLAGYSMEPPYAVADQFVSIDIGDVRYQPGDSAELRVRLRDSNGRPVPHATVEAVLRRDGKPAATVLLDGDANQGGVFRGKTPPLVEGEYEVAVRVTGFPEDAMKARTRFMVEQTDSGEMSVVACNEDLLRHMAGAAGGRYLREEQAGDLVELLAPLSAGRIVESETVLWQSYWWFTPIVALLSIEWFLRKRHGML